MTPCRKGLHDLDAPGGRRDQGKQQCCQCNLAYQRQWHKDYWRRLAAARAAAKVERGCAHCGYNTSPHALQFDHIVPIRDGALNEPIKHMASLRRVLADPNVQVLCANCHAIKTHISGENMARKAVA